MALSVASKLKIRSDVSRCHVEGLQQRRHESGAVLKDSARGTALDPLIDFDQLAAIDVALLQEPELTGKVCVEDECPGFEIEIETPAVEVCTGNQSRVTIDADGLGVQESAFEFMDVYAGLQQREVVGSTGQSHQLRIVPVWKDQVHLDSSSGGHDEVHDRR